MAGFVSSDVEPLEYDFTAHGGGKGTSPEPSSAQMKAYRRSIAAVFGTQIDSAQDALAEAGTQEKTNEALLAQARASLKALSADDEAEMEQLTQAASDVLSGVPSVEEIGVLPHRVKQAYFGWLVGTLLRPEAQTLATKD